jgi:DNA-directed RNA polymerase subunit RPC12/RpoP
MSELEYMMVCPYCNKKAIVMFAGSGTKGTCMDCGKDLPPEKHYYDYDGVVIAYTG